MKWQSLLYVKLPPNHFISIVFDGLRWRIFLYVADMSLDSATNVPLTSNPFSSSRLMKWDEMLQVRDT